MRPRPTVVAFDIIETVFSLETLRERLEGVGLPGTALEVWFARILRDGFALETTDVYKPFAEVASATLANLLTEYDLPAASATITSVLDGFAGLLPHPDAEAAFRCLRNANIRIVALTNGSAENTEKLLRSAGLEQFVERMISIEEVHHWKPRREVYLHAANRVGVDPQHLALVAAHGWDIHGGSCAGLTTGFVSRGRLYPTSMMAPHITADSLAGVAGALVRLGQRNTSTEGAG